MQETGLFKFWNMNEEMKSDKEIIAEQNVKNQDLSEMTSIYICWAIGIALATVALFLELLMIFCTTNVKHCIIPDQFRYHFTK